MSRSTYRVRRLEPATLEHIEHDVRLGRVDERALVRLVLMLVNEIRRLHRWTLP